MALIFDAHSDLLNDVFPRRQSGERGILARTWLPGMKKGGIGVRVAAVFSDPVFLPESALRRALDMISILYDEVDESGYAKICRNTSEIRECSRQGKIAFLIGMEGAEPLGSDLDLLRVFHELGLRILGLTHSFKNPFAQGASLSPDDPGPSEGLSRLGFELVEKAGHLGMIIDVSHLNDPGFQDVLSISQAPVIASHSNCRALLNHPRNLTDLQIKAIADRGGVIGVNACRCFVNGQDVDSLLEHIDHIVQIGGIEHAGLGPDFADYLIPHLSLAQQRNLPLEGMKPVDGFSGDEDFARMPEILLRRGYNSRAVDLIMGENFLRVLQTVIG